MNSRNRRALTGFTLILIYVLGFLVFWFFNFQRVVVRGHSMDPTLSDGQVLWASRAYWLVRPIARKDIIVIRDEGQGGYIIKRVHRLGGETVDDTQFQPADMSFSEGADRYVVPPNQYYVLGDNLEVSQDSRAFGPVPREKVIGKYVAFTWQAFVLAATPVIAVLMLALSRPKRQPTQLIEQGNPI